MVLDTPPEAPAPRPDEPARPGTLEIRGLSKAFPNVQALADVSLDVRGGEILAFMGENGAGKSTLLKILNGDYQPDQGTMTMDGEALRFSSPREARRAGIRVIYQEPEIIPGVDVAENIYAGDLPTRGPFVDRGRLDRQVAADLRRYGFESVLPLSLDGRPAVRRPAPARRDRARAPSPGPASSPSTSRPRRSPTRRSSGCSGWFGGCATKVSRSSTCRTGSTRSCDCRTGSRSCAMAG